MASIGLLLSKISPRPCQSVCMLGISIAITSYYSAKGNNQQLKLLFDRLKEQFAHERRSHEQKMAEAKARLRSSTSTESLSCSDHESDSDDDSAAPENTFRMSTKSSGTAAVEERCSDTTEAEETLNPSKSQVVNNDQEAQSSPPAPYSPPAAILPYMSYKDNDCDEAEKIARVKRIEVILKLSAEAKAKEAEKKRVANIKPLTWDKPTFDYPSSTSNSSTTTAAAAADSKASQESTSGKRKPSSNPYFGPGRAPTEEEIQSLVDFANSWFPKRRRITDDKSGDDSEKPKSA